ncbi:unnamed protein product [Haemonchus placei]|uniref:ELMO domain-containing protein n=1 Tax=Haemonchus placei TaxID=6290 RepID=A0A158QK37_HAEPC|nr:unnamed protein product [Haemonchus placei]
MFSNLITISCYAFQKSAEDFFEETVESVQDEEPCKELLKLLSVINACCSRFQHFANIIREVGRIDYCQLTLSIWDRMLNEYLTSELMSERKTDLRSQMKISADQDPPNDDDLIDLVRIHMAFVELRNYRLANRVRGKDESEWYSIFNRGIKNFLELAKEKALARISLSCQLDVPIPSLDSQPDRLPPDQGPQREDEWVKIWRARWTFHVFNEAGQFAMAPLLDGFGSVGSVRTPMSISTPVPTKPRPPIEIARSMLQRLKNATAPLMRIDSHHKELLYGENCGGMRAYESATFCIFYPKLSFPQMMVYWDRIDVNEITLRIDYTKTLVDFLCNSVLTYTKKIFANLNDEGFSADLQMFVPTPLLQLFCSAINNSEQVRRSLMIHEKLHLDDLAIAYEKAGHGDSISDNIDEEYDRLVKHLHDSARKAERLHDAKRRLSLKALELIRQRGSPITS